MGNKHYIAYGGFKLRLIEIKDDLTLSFAAEYRIGTLKPAYFSMNEKHYLVLPSVYFMAVLDITDFNNMTIIDNLH